MRKHSSFGETTADGYVELFYIRWNGSGVIRNALLARLNLTPRDIKYDQESRLKAICETDRIGKEQGSGHIPWFTFECIDETLQSLAPQEVRNAVFYAVAMAAGKSPAGAIRGDQLVHAAQRVEEAAEEADVRFLWYPPVRF